MDFFSETIFLLKSDLVTIKSNIKVTNYIIFDITDFDLMCFYCGKFTIEKKMFIPNITLYFLKGIK